MPLSLFGNNPKSRIEDRTGLASEFAHTFGGQCCDYGYNFLNAPLPLHLIYRLELRDPVIPFSVPKVDFLPLLYCFNYGCDCSYQVVSNTEIKLIEPVKQKYFFPPWEAPESFPVQSTSLSLQDYDPTNADDVMDWKGVFGWDELSDKERERDWLRARTIIFNRRRRPR